MGRILSTSRAKHVKEIKRKRERITKLTCKAYEVFKNADSVGDMLKIIKIERTIESLNVSLENDLLALEAYDERMKVKQRTLGLCHDAEMLAGERGDRFYEKLGL